MYKPAMSWDDLIVFARFINPANCVVVDNCLFEVLHDDYENHYRIILDIDDYDYIYDEALIKRINKALRLRRELDEAC